MLCLRSRNFDIFRNFEGFVDTVLVLCENQELLEAALALVEELIKM